MTITFSEEELLSRQPSPEHVAQGVEAIGRDGYVVLEGVVDLEHIRVLREKMLEDYPLILQRTDTPFNFNRSNIQQEPPPFPPYLFQDVMFNEFVIAISHQILGDGFRNNFYSGNTALPNTKERQPVHADIGHLWPNMAVATPAYALVINVPIVDFTPFNGSTEIWPGTQLDTSVAMQSGDCKISPEKIETQRVTQAPIQPEIKAGSIVMRDIRMWHAGMPNHSDQARPMIAMIHWVGWWSHGDKIKFPVGTEELFEHPILQWEVEFVEGELPYLGNCEAFDVAEPGMK